VQERNYERISHLGNHYWNVEVDETVSYILY